MCIRDSLLWRDGVLALFPQGDVPGNQTGGHARAGAHDAAGDEHRGDVQTRDGLEVGRDGFIAARRKNHAIPGNGAGMDLHHVSNRLARGEHIVHAVMSLRAAIADVRDMVMGGIPSALQNAYGRLFGKRLEMYAARMRIARCV